MTTAALHPVLLHHIVNTLGWPALRPLQEQAIPPLLRGDDALVVAGTAGGKTEAAVFPLLSAMAEQAWGAPSLLYVCPLRALLNNLEPRLATYASWLGRRAALRHGDTPDGVRRRLLADPPDVLLTTPESLEAMLVSTRVDAHEYFASVRAVVVDEVHAFAGDDRGWHLLALLERLQRLAGRPLQRVGLSATVGNPDELLTWLQGSGSRLRAASVVRPAAEPTAAVDVTLDYVGSVSGAATVIAALHGGEKRLVFAESRRQVEELAGGLREHGVDTFVSHSSLSVDERRRAESAFAESRNCVIVSTSTLELGVDVGDLDRMIQVDSPRTVASFLQRLGRTGRRPGTARNALLLATSESSLLLGAGVLSLWGSGWVEPVVPPPSPRHVLAQQLLALVLQERHVGDRTWTEWFSGLDGLTDDAEEIAGWLVASGHLESDSGMLSMGAASEARYGRRNFMELLSVFTSEQQFAVLAGRSALGHIDPLMLTARIEGPRLLALAGRGWRVTHVDWRSKRCWVEPADAGAGMRWQSQPQPLSYEVCQARRAVLLGAEPPVRLTGRAIKRLGLVRAEQRPTVTSRGSILDLVGGWWWTWAGARGNATLAAALSTIVDARTRYENDRVKLKDQLASEDVRLAVDAAGQREFPAPPVDARALDGLKFSDVLPPRLAMATLADRMTDEHAARETVTARSSSGP